MITVRVFRMFDNVTCTVMVEPMFSNGWPQVPQPPYSLAYVQEEEEGQWETPADMLPMITRALEAANQRIHQIHGGMFDSIA